LPARSLSGSTARQNGVTGSTPARKAIPDTTASMTSGVTTSIRPPAGMPANDFSSTFTWGSRLAWNLASQSVAGLSPMAGCPRLFRLPVVREHPGEPPVLVVDLLDDDMGLLGLLAEHTNE